MRSVMRLITWGQSIICTLVLFSFTAAAPAHAQDFTRAQISSTTYTTPLFQMRFSPMAFNPPLIFDIGNTAATQNIFQGLSLGGFTSTFQITPATANRTIVAPDAGGTIALMPAAGGTITTNGTAVNTGVCQAQPALTIAGVTTASTVSWSVPTALPATWQTGIHVMSVVTANTVTLSLCNASAGSITPAAQVVNIRAFN